jgi:putative tryptophan/tyrosine transport system substrate-binding protein
VSGKLWLRNCLWLLTIFLLASIHLAEAEQQKVFRIGVLTLHTQDRPHLQGLRDGLKNAGYIEGKNLVLNMMRGESPDKLRSMAKNYSEEKMDIIVTTGNAETVVAKTAWVIPIIFMPAAEPVQSGFIKSLARPGANVTGVAYYGDFKIHGKDLEVFREAVPNLQRVLTLYDSGEQLIPAVSLPLVRKVAAQLAIKLVDKPVQSLLKQSRKLQQLPGILRMASFLFVRVYSATSKRSPKAQEPKRFPPMDVPQGQ